MKEDKKKKERNDLKWQIVGCVILACCGGLLLELQHGFGWTFLLLSLITGFEALAEEIRIEVL